MNFNTYSLGLLTQVLRITKLSSVFHILPSPDQALQNIVPVTVQDIN